MEFCFVLIFMFKIIPESHEFIPAVYICSSDNNHYLNI